MFRQEDTTYYEKAFRVSIKIMFIGQFGSPAAQLSIAGLSAPFIIRRKQSYYKPFSLKQNEANSKGSFNPGETPNRNTSLLD